MKCYSLSPSFNCVVYFTIVCSAMCRHLYCFRLCPNTSPHQLSFNVGTQLKEACHIWFSMYINGGQCPLSLHYCACSQRAGEVAGEMPTLAVWTPQLDTDSIPNRPLLTTPSQRSVNPNEFTLIAVEGTLIKGYKYDRQEWEAFFTSPPHHGNRKTTMYVCYTGAQITTHQDRSYIILQIILNDSIWLSILSLSDISNQMFLFYLFKPGFL